MKGIQSWSFKTIQYGCIYILINIFCNKKITVVNKSNHKTNHRQSENQKMSWSKPHHKGYSRLHDAYSSLPCTSAPPWPHCGLSVFLCPFTVDLVTCFASCCGVLAEVTVLHLQATDGLTHLHSPPLAFVIAQEELPVDSCWPCSFGSGWVDPNHRAAVKQSLPHRAQVDLENPGSP